MIFSILKKLRGKNLKDISLRFRKILYQKTILLKPYNFYYTDNYLLKNVKEKNIDTLIENFQLNKKSLFDLDNSKPIIEDVELIKSAKQIMMHRFDLLGSGLVCLDFGEVYKGLEKIQFKPNKGYIPKKNLLDIDYKPINWSVDFKSGFQWDLNVFYSEVRSTSSIKGVDIKVPWELSRCQHFGVLGAAYQMTKDSKYAREIRNQIIDWINNNPYCYGPNWVCAMDVGIRAANWLMAFDLVKEAKVFDYDFTKLFLKSLLHHVKYLENNLEWTSKLTSNHYLSDLGGLFFLNKYFKSYSGSAKLEKFCYAELEKEIFKQTYDDGMNSEGSTSYHRLVLEIFAYCFLLDRRTNKQLSNSYIKRLEKMFDFSGALLKPNGCITQIGDNDSGIFFKFKNREILDHSYLLILDHILTGRIYEPGKLDFSSPEYVLLNFPEWHNKKIKNVNTKSACYQFNFSGLYIYKSDDTFITIYNGQNGQNGNGGHAHNDKLSFTLTYRGVDVFIDPGTYLYTPIPNERNKFRSTYSHNTVGVESFEQNRYIDGYLFGLVEDSKEFNNEFKLNKIGFTYEGSHDGFTRINQDLKHTRKINYQIDQKTITIKDSFDDNNYLKKASFILNSGLIKKIEDNKVVLLNGEITFKHSSTILSEKFVYSKAYGEIDEKHFSRIEVQFSKELETKIKFK